MKGSTLGFKLTHGEYRLYVGMLLTEKTANNTDGFSFIINELSQAFAALALNRQREARLL